MSQKEFETFFRENYDSIHGIGLKVLKDYQRAEDCANKTFETAFNKIHEVTESKRESWLRQVAWNNAKIAYRKVKRDKDFLEYDIFYDDLYCHQKTPRKILTQLDFLKLVRKEILKLDKRSRHCLLLQLEQEYSLKQIAAETGLRINNIKSILRRAKIRVKEELSTECPAHLR
jgi:RNA polymerase sigma-70 factor (ECF subfamily)